MTETEITKLTGLQPSRRQNLIRFYARLTEPERLAVHAEHREKYNQNRRQWQKSKELLSYCLLILVLEERYRIKNIGRSRKSTQEDLKLAERHDIERIKGQRHRQRSGAKRDQVLLHMPLIRRWHEEEQISWREIAAYLSEKYQLEVAHSYISKLYSENISSTPGRPPASAVQTADSQ